MEGVRRVWREISWNRVFLTNRDHQKIENSKRDCQQAREILLRNGNVICIICEIFCSIQTKMYARLPKRFYRLNNALRPEKFIDAKVTASNIKDNNLFHKQEWSNDEVVIRRSVTTDSIENNHQSINKKTLFTEVKNLLYGINIFVTLSARKSLAQFDHKFSFNKCLPRGNYSRLNT